jgi:hypothetical protein
MDGVLDKCGRCEFRRIKIAATDLVTTEAQLANTTSRNEFE